MAYTDIGSVSERLLMGGFEAIMEPLDELIDNTSNHRARELAEQLREQLLPVRSVELTIKMSGKSDDLEVMVRTIVEKLREADAAGMKCRWTCDVEGP